jgi:hypothetical protein
VLIKLLPFALLAGAAYYILRTASEARLTPSEMGPSSVPGTRI